MLFAIYFDYNEVRLNYKNSGGFGPVNISTIWLPRTSYTFGIEFLANTGYHEVCYFYKVPTSIKYYLFLYNKNKGHRQWRILL